MNESFGRGDISNEPEEAEEVEETPEEVPEPWSSQVVGVYSHATSKVMDIVQVEVPKGSIVKGPVEIANL